VVVFQQWTMSMLPFRVRSFRIRLLTFVVKSSEERWLGTWYTTIDTGS